MIKEVLLIHHSHTDIGYTDLPSTTWTLHVEFIRQALQAARETRDYPPEARFHWTCEALVIVEAFLKQATSDERLEFDALIDCGQFEVTAMPFNIHPFLGQEEWTAIMHRLRPLFERYRPVTAFQNDINGFPWGLIPSLSESGVKYLWMGSNPYSAELLKLPPQGFCWQGPTEATLLTWVGYMYNAGHSWFHRGEWRRGPVPSAHDVWFHPPAAGETFGTTPEQLESAHAVLLEHLAEVPADYRYPVLPLPVTNEWRSDNDAPCRQLSDFVQAWNALGLQPRLRLGTPRMFMAQLESSFELSPTPAEPTSLPTLRGDWPEWWADGPASMPVELALSQRNKRGLADLERGAQALESTSPLRPEMLSSLWHTASLVNEHTWGSYESGAYPYKPRTLGGWVQKLDLVYRTDEDLRSARAQLIRSSPRFRPSSQTRFLGVLNPGPYPRSGWATLSAQALRSPVNAVRDLQTGRILPLEVTREMEWSEPRPEPSLPFEMPNDTWGWMPSQARFRVHGLASGETRHFELVQMDLPDVPRSPPQGQNAHFEWEWNPRTGRLGHLRDRLSRVSLLEAHSAFGLGDPVFESVRGFGAREVLAARFRNPASVTVSRTPAQLESWTALPCAYGARYERVWSHPQVHRLEQTVEFPDDLRRVELTTTLWLREWLDPQAIWLAFPFALKGAELRYASLGHPTRPGLDQLPESCGELYTVNAGLELSSPALTLALSTPDTPLVSLGAIHSRDGQHACVPPNSEVYALLTQNYWTTNFSITKAGKLTVRHIVQLDPPDSTPLQLTGEDLWTFPSSRE